MTRLTTAPNNPTANFGPAHGKTKAQTIRCDCGGRAALVEEAKPDRFGFTRFWVCTRMRCGARWPAHEGWKEIVRGLAS